MKRRNFLMGLPAVVAVPVALALDKPALPPISDNKPHSKIFVFPDADQC